MARVRGAARARDLRARRDRNPRRILRAAAPRQRRHRDQVFRAHWVVHRPRAWRAHAHGRHGGGMGGGREARDPRHVQPRPSARVRPLRRARVQALPHRRRAKGRSRDPTQLMSYRFTRAIVRPPSANFADGLTSVALGRPDFMRALDQHARYCEALERCGLRITRLPEDPAHPDATFVEDTAMLSARCNVIARPGAPSRAGEVVAIREALAAAGVTLGAIEAPGTLD